MHQDVMIKKQTFQKLKPWNEAETKRVNTVKLR